LFVSSVTVSMQCLTFSSSILCNTVSHYTVHSITSAVTTHWCTQFTTQPQTDYIIIIIIILYYAIYGSKQAHKRKQLIYIKTTSKIQKRQYKSKSTGLRTLSHPTRNRATAAGPAHNTDAPHRRQERLNSTTRARPDPHGPNGVFRIPGPQKNSVRVRAGPVGPVYWNLANTKQSARTLSGRVRSGLVRSGPCSGI